MRGTIVYGPRRLEARDAPTIVHPTDAMVRIAATCLCGSDLWPYRGMNGIAQPAPMACEYCGIVEEAGKAVTSISLANSSSARSLPLTTAVRTATMAISAPANSRELTDLLERQHDLQRLTTLYRTSTARKPTNIEKEHERQDWT